MEFGNTNDINEEELKVKVCNAVKGFVISLVLGVVSYCYFFSYLDTVLRLIASFAVFMVIFALLLMIVEKLNHHGTTRNILLE